jgi:transposase
MKKNITPKKQSPKRAATTPQGPITLGLDLGDKASRCCVLNHSGEILLEDSVGTNRKALTEKFSGMQGCRVAMEVGTHSPWVSRLLSKLGLEVIVANARQVKLISDSSRKSDRMDARLLARLARIDPELLRPIRHRSEEAQMDLMQIRIREELVEARTKLINGARGMVKALGERLPQCDADNLGTERMERLPESLRETLKPVMEPIEELTRQIHRLDQRIEQIARSKYPETELLRQVWGVGTLIALTFVLTIEDQERFSKSRDVGSYVGLRPRQSESGERQPQLRITKEGDPLLRKLLVQGAHCVMSQRGPDTDLKRWGRKLMERGGKNGKKRALVAVARKLAVLLHRLWVCGEVYEPLRNSQATCKQAA